MHDAAHMLQNALLLNLPYHGCPRQEVAAVIAMSVDPQKGALGEASLNEACSTACKEHYRQQLLQLPDTDKEGKKQSRTCQQPVAVSCRAWWQQAGRTKHVSACMLPHQYVLQGQRPAWLLLTRCSRWTALLRRCTRPTTLSSKSRVPQSS
jgi:hypothetical protein